MMIDVEKLAQSKNDAVRCWVAQWSETPVEVLVHLAEDPVVEVRGGVASNPNAPREVLLALGTDTWPQVREKAASNPKAPKEILERLVFDTDSRVRFAAASNPNLPARLIRRLVKTYTAHDMGLCGLATNPKTPMDLLMEFWERGVTFVRLHALQNPKLPTEILREVALHGAGQERFCASRNPGAPPDVLALLASRLDLGLLLGLVANPAAPFALIEETITQTMPQHIQEALAFAAINNRGLALEEAIHLAKKYGFGQSLPHRLLNEMHRLPKDGELWLKMVRVADEAEREIIKAHPYGAQVALLIALGA